MLIAVTHLSPTLAVVLGGELLVLIACLAILLCILAAIADAILSLRLRVEEGP